MKFRLLGPVGVQSDGRNIPLGGAKPTALLVALLLARGRVVTPTRLIDVLWGEHPPSTARALVQTYVSTLRRRGLDEIILTRHPGYLARISDDDLDLSRFERLLADGRQAAATGDHSRAVQLLRSAEQLWTGRALSGLDGALLVSEAARLEELRLTAREERIAAELALGRHDHVVPELIAMVGVHPTNERLRARLMTALYRLGRQADALACYREGREALISELGVEPGPDLTELHAAILRGDLPIAEPPVAAAAMPVPAQLPLVTDDFVGRDAELQNLLPLSGVHVIAGPGGMGKTCLAVCLGHRCRDAFPDGQLFAELHGMSDVPADPAEVLGRFLRALGVDAADVPDSVEERGQLFRSLVTGRRVLVVLDDAADECQVRPLLPGNPGCAVLITSRDRLAGLTGASLTELDVLSSQEALTLLGRLIGAERIATDAESAERIAAHCARLPLAIRVAGARLASRRRLPLSWLADRLADESRRLHELNAGDLGVRASIQLSYRGLPAQAKAALRRLGYLGVPSFGPWLVGWLMDLPETEGERLVEALVDAQLVEFAGVDRLGQLRYRLHDLVRIFARERAELDEPRERLTASVARAVTAWLALVQQVIASSPPDDIRWTHPPVAPHPVSDDLVQAVRADPARWFETEQPSLIAGVERAAALGLRELACAFAPEQYSQVFAGESRFEARERVIMAVLNAARAAHDSHREAIMLADLGQLRYMQDQYVRSRQLYSEALRRFRELGDEHGQAASLAGLGGSCRESGQLTEAAYFLDLAARVLEKLGDDTGIGYTKRLVGSVRLEQGRYDDAYDSLEQALAAYRRVGSDRGEGLTLRSLGLYHRARSEYELSARYCRLALIVFRRIGHEILEAYALHSLAKTLFRMGQVEQALPQLERSLSASRAAQDRFGQALTLRSLGELHLQAGRLDVADSFLSSAMGVWKALGLPLWAARNDRDLALLRRAQGDAEIAAGILARARTVFQDHGAREYFELDDLRPDALWHPCLLTKSEQAPHPAGRSRSRRTVGVSRTGNPARLQRFYSGMDEHLLCTESRFDR